MRLEEAIEILKGFYDQAACTLDAAAAFAFKLGIEALKEIKWLRESQVLRGDELLPGETEESQ